MGYKIVPINSQRFSMTIALQLRSENTLSSTLNGQVIAFSPLEDARGVSEALINQFQLEQIASALAQLPHKIDAQFEVSKGANYRSVNSPDW
jgi:hypothetical protein